MGTVTLCQALRRLGKEVSIVSDGPNLRVLRGLCTEDTKVIDFPWGERDASRAEARRLLDQLEPSLLLAVERVGFAQGERYLNNRGMDITLAMSKLDYLFEGFPASIGIGDMGNEIGMGSLAKPLILEDVTPYPALTRTTHTIVASTSLWGAYGLVAGLSLLSGEDLLPSEDQQEEWLHRTVELGASDAITGRRDITVDTHTLSECNEVLADLHRLVRQGKASRSAAGQR